MARLARGLPLVLTLLAWAAGCSGAFKLGPRPKAAPGLIVRYRSSGGVGIAAVVAGTSGPKVIAPSLNMYKLDIEDGTPPEVKAAQLTKLGGVLYAIPDTWVSIAAGPRQRSSEPLAAGQEQAARDARTLLFAAGSAATVPPPRMPVGTTAKSPPPAARRPAPPPPLARGPARALPAPSPRPSPRPGPAPPPPLARGPARVLPAPSPRPSPRPGPKPPLPRPPTPHPPSNVVRPASVQPTDPMYDDQWALPHIRAPRAWTYLSNASPVLHCIVDTGVKWDHPDLAANLVYASEDFKRNNYDDNGHGTHVAGIMGAVANNRRGISGAAWRSRILACKALDATGWGLISKVVECIEYCRAKGARVINTSFVLTELNVALRDAISNGTAAGVFFAGAAGNAGSDNDQANYYPGGFAFPGNVAVANIDSGSFLHSSSNYGATSVQVAAPGANILSTWIYRDVANQYYAYETGTSMAAPYVSAAAGLAIAASGGRVTNAEVADALVATSTPVPQLQGKVVSNGYINLEKLVIWAINRGKQLAAASAAGR